MRILCTSQVPLGVDGETVFELAPLALSDAMELFTRRAHREEAGTRSSVVRSTVCRWRSNWPRAPRRCRSRRSPAASTTASACCCYLTYAAGDVERAPADFDDNIEWSIPGNSTISGNYRGKDKFLELLGKLAEKSFTTTPERIVGEGDDVVVISKITAGGESGLQADVLAYRNGKLVKAQSIADTALQERVFGKK